MTDQHRATPEQWSYLQEEATKQELWASCIVELRDRIEALEAAQLEQAESHRFCVDAIVRRVEALEATQHAHADVSRLSDAEREQVVQELAKPAAWRPLETKITYGSDAAIPAFATAQQILHAPMVVEGTFEHGGETCRFKAKPERESAMDELRAASAEAQGFAVLSWSEERQPCEECRYNHCIAETPFGRFLISWKGWKEHAAVTADETPFGDWFECWNSVEEAKSGCQSEYNRRLALVPLSQPQPELRAASAEVRPAKGLVLRVSEANNSRDAIRTVAAWLRTGRLLHAAELLEMEADRG